MGASCHRGLTTKAIPAIEPRSDDGLSFPRARQTLVYSGLGGYSCLTQVPPVQQAGAAVQRLGLLWETGVAGACVGSACRIVFSLIDV